MNKAQKLLAGLSILSHFNMEELELVPINEQYEFNTTWKQARSAYLCIHIPFKDSLALEDDEDATQSLYSLGWTMEQDCEFWIFRD